MVESQDARMPPLFLRLLPFSTDAPLSTNLLEHIPSDSPYTPFVQELQLRAIQIDLGREPCWGTFPPLDVLNSSPSVSPVGADSPLSNVSRDSRRSGKLTSVVADGLANYTTAYMLFDVITRYTNGSLAEDVGAMPHQGSRCGWVGPKNLRVRYKISKHLVDLQTTVDIFSDHARKLKQIAGQGVASCGPHTESSCSVAVDATTRVAQQIVGYGKLKKAVNIVRNFANVAFCINIMKKGFPHMPELPSETHCNPDARWGPHTLVAIKDVYAFTNGPKPLRQALQLAVGLTPLLVVTPVDLTKAGICAEETMLNTKRRGNMQPSLVRQLEADIWALIFSVAEGRIDAMEAVTSLHERWEQRHLKESLSSQDRNFFRSTPCGFVEYSHEMSLFDTYPQQPVSLTWAHAREVVLYTAAEHRGQRAQINPSAIPVPPAVPPIQPGSLHSLAAKVVGLEVPEHPLSISLPPSPSISQVRPVTPGPNGDEASLTGRAADSAFSGSMVEQTQPHGDLGAGVYGGDDDNLFGASPSDQTDDARPPLYPAATKHGQLELEGITGGDGPPSQWEDRQTHDEEELVDELISDAEGNATDAARMRSDNSSRARQQGWSGATQPSKDSSDRTQGSPAAGSLGKGSVTLGGRAASGDGTEGDKGAGPDKGGPKGRRRRPGKDQRRSQKQGKAGASSGKTSFRRVGQDSGPSQTEESQTIQGDSGQVSGFEPDPILIDYDTVMQGKKSDQFRMLGLLTVDHPELRVKDEDPEELELLSGAVESLLNEDFERPDVEVEGADGEIHRFKLSVHHQSYYDSLAGIFNAAAKARRDKTAPQLYYICTETEFEDLTPEEFCRIFSTRNIVITDCQSPSMAFEPKYLKRIQDMNIETVIQDQSVLIHDGKYYQWTRKGTLNDIYRASVAPPREGKCLNGLNFPSPHAALETSIPASDVHALLRTKDDAGCVSNLSPEDVRFNLVATKGAFHFPHLDNCGDATWVHVLTGEKVWAVAEPVNEADISSSDLWTSETLDVENLDLSLWNVRALLLPPRSKVVMRPATLHIVYTKEHSICSGGHFLPVGNLVRVVIGLIHTFFEGDVITNTEFPLTFPPRLNALAGLFHRVFCLRDEQDLDKGHYPDIYTHSGLMELVLFACAIEVQNAVCTLSYQSTSDPYLLTAFDSVTPKIDVETVLPRWDVNAIPHEHRIGNACSRGRMQSVLEAVFSRVSIIDSKGKKQDPWKFVFIPTLARLIAGLTNYMAKSRSLDAILDDKDESSNEGASGGKAGSDGEGEPTLFSRNLDWICMRWPTVEPLLHRRFGRACSSAQNAIYPMVEFNVEPCEPKPNKAVKFPEGQALLELGSTPGDLLYFAAYDYFRLKHVHGRGANHDAGERRTKRSATLEPGHRDASSRESSSSARQSKRLKAST